MNPQQSKTAEQLLLSSAYDPQAPPPPEQCIFRMHFKRIGNLKDYILFTGKKSSGKTKVVCAGIAAALSRNEVLKMSIKLPDNKRKVAHFDTEQGEGSHYRMMQLIKKFAGFEDLPPHHFNSFRCRTLSAFHIMNMVEFYLTKNSDCGMLFLDGMLDTVDSMNDEKAANAMKQRLQRITEENNVLIAGIIHRGFSADKAIGHIGSYLERGAQTVLKIEQTKKDNISYYTISTEYIREDAPPPDTSFYYNIQTNDWELFELAPAEIPAGSRERKTAKNSPLQYDIQEHTRRCGQIFDATAELLSWDQLSREIQAAYNCTRNEARGEYYQYLLSNGMIYKTENGYTNKKVMRLFIEK